jgi:D-alanyl-lipoteichoic acid acyltransferase DltB (MBOAT superfamily)
MDPSMMFNSWQFLWFFLLVYTVYLLLRHRSQNLFLLVVSYWFYAAWDARFCLLMAATTVVDFCCGLGMAATQRKGLRKLLLWTSVGSNLTVLGFFKYYNFFLGSLDDLLAPLGVSVHQLHLHIILPVGVSFYTFQAISYTAEVYRGTLQPTRRLLDFALMVAFFPQLVAGPIERARVLLEQVQKPRTLTPERFFGGLWLIGWGLWKKVVLADNLGGLVDPLFARSDLLTAAEAYLAVAAFAFQIYCDFSAYSDIARGTARLLGFELMLNFNNPYLADSPSDFWKRWHISLSTWLRDYLYIPLGGNRGSTLLTYRNLMLTMVLGGLWHGAAWNFVWWGVYHGLLLCLWRALAPGTPSSVPLWRKVLAVGGMFQLTLFGWLLFRCNRTLTLANGTIRDDSFRQIVEMLTSFQNGLGLDAGALALLGPILACAVPLLVLEALLARQGKVGGEFQAWPRPTQIALASTFGFTALFWAVPHAEAFIYFQF